ncbi:unnamed protein product [Ceutorhynchus assimilis]|uniref:Uncharacterized protein n=1 Tax=Ceutorhynchus assimilis TaxID=467358 RepID=A0A9N9MAK1_9CUCU|nr:unnamed protein product [Ceutorhynchus assimilis]
MESQNQELVAAGSPAEVPNDPGKMFIGGLSWQTSPGCCDDLGYFVIDLKILQLLELRSQLICATDSRQIFVSFRKYWISVKVDTVQVYVDQVALDAARASLGRYLDSTNCSSNKAYNASITSTAFRESCSRWMSLLRQNALQSQSLYYADLEAFPQKRHRSDSVLSIFTRW